MTNRAEVLAAATRHSNAAQANVDELVSMLDYYLDILLDAEDTIQEQAKCIDTLEIDLADALEDAAGWKESYMRRE